MQSTQTTLPSGKAVSIHQLSLRKLAAILGALKTIPAHLQDVDKLKSEEVMAKLPAIIGSSMEELAKIVAICCDLSEESILDDLNLADITALVREILTVNRFEEVAANLKAISGLASRPAPAKATPTAGSTK